MNKVIKSGWLCFRLTKSGASEDCWVRGSIRPYKDAVNSYNQAGELIFRTKYDWEVWLQELPEWSSGIELGQSTYLYFETKDTLVPTDETWAKVIKVRDFTIGVKRKKMFSLVCTTDHNDPLSNKTPPASPTPDMAERLIEAERMLHNTLLAASNLTNI